MLNSLKEPTRCRIHSRATKIGARMWKRKELCSKGVPCRSRMRKRIKPSSDSSISSLRRAKLTRAALTTERSVAIASSRRTKPWSRTRIVCSGNTSVVTAKTPRLTALPDGLLDELERRYALDKLGPAERLAGGYANDVFRLPSAAGPQVVPGHYPPARP